MNARTFFPAMALALALSSLPLVTRAEGARDTVSYSLNARMAPGLGKWAPFLSTVNQWDRHLLSPNGLSLWANAYKTVHERRPFDYGFGLELNANASPTETRWFPSEAYAEGKVLFLHVVAGMKRRVLGNQDILLSSGGTLSSANSRPVPSLTFEVPDWVNVPFTGGFFSFKGGMENGCFVDNGEVRNALLHRKWLHVRLGGNLPLSLDYGLHHVAQWGGTSTHYATGDLTFDNFMRIFLGKSGDASVGRGEQVNTLGNHMVAKNLGLGLRLPSLEVHAYWQNLYDDRPIFRMNKAANVADGLFGLSFRTPRFRPLQAWVLEYFSSTDRSGPWHNLDGIVYGGGDSYYNNFVYVDGWSNYKMCMGQPWITSPKYNTDGSTFFENTGVHLYHFSGMGAIGNCDYRLTCALSRNYGWQSFPKTDEQRQLSLQMEVGAPFPLWKKTRCSIGLSGDWGRPYGNNLAVLLGLSYSGLFTY
jgi:hypothetical protein